MGKFLNKTREVLRWADTLWGKSQATGLKQNHDTACVGVEWLNQAYECFVDHKVVYQYLAFARPNVFYECDAVGIGVIKPLFPNF